MAAADCKTLERWSDFFMTVIFAFLKTSFQLSGHLSQIRQGMAGKRCSVGVNWCYGQSTAPWAHGVILKT